VLACILHVHIQLEGAYLALTSENVSVFHAHAFNIALLLAVAPPTAQYIFRREFSVRASLRATAVAGATQREPAPNDGPFPHGYARPRGVNGHYDDGASPHSTGQGQTRSARRCRK
jgi:hypothetical protein